MSKSEASLVEVFSSFQGEGLYVGERQIFVRFAGCNLSCQYCDTPQALQVPKTFKVETVPGTRKYEQHNNPAGLDELIAIINGLDKPAGNHHSISLTGGEPLLQVDIIKQLIPKLKHKYYLETNGVLPDHLAEVIELIDIVAMDIKLPSATGLSPYWKEHKKALETAYLKEVFVKIVFTRDSKVKEIDEAASLIAGVDENIQLVLQPVSPHTPTNEQIFAFFNTARRKLKKVRVIPQAHKGINLL